MTAARRSGSGAERDRVVATLRRELLVPFDDEVAASHLEAMLLEFDWKLDPEPVAETATRRPMLRVRAVVASCMAAAALTVTGGFAAVGALPAPAQHLLSRTTRIVGIRLPDAPAPPPVDPPKIRTHPITTPPVEPLLPEPKRGPAARPAGRGIAMTPPSTPRSGPAVEPRAASPSAVAPGTADAPGNARSSEAKAMNNAGGNGNDNSVGNGNGSGKSTPASSAATGGASKGKATAPVPAKRSPK
jgi:hypothetical protein